MPSHAFPVSGRRLSVKRERHSRRRRDIGRQSRAEFEPISGAPIGAIARAQVLASRGDSGVALVELLRHAREFHHLAPSTCLVRAVFQYSHPCVVLTRCAKAATLSEGHAR